MLKFTDLYFRASGPSDIELFFVHKESVACLIFDSHFFKITPSDEIKFDELTKYDFGNGWETEIEIIAIKAADTVENAVYILCKDKSIIKIYFTQDNYKGQAVQCFSVYRPDNDDEEIQKHYTRVSNEFRAVKNVKLSIDFLELPDSIEIEKSPN